MSKISLLAFMGMALMFLSYLTWSLGKSNNQTGIELTSPLLIFGLTRLGHKNVE
jgi:hypothetical protein